MNATDRLEMGPLRVSRLCAKPGDGGTGVGHRRGGHIHHVPDSGRTGAIQQAAGSFNIHLIELRGAAHEGNLCCQVDDSFCAFDCSP